MAAPSRSSSRRCNNNRTRRIDDDEFERLLRYADDPIMDARLRFAIGTGARQGGMMSLRVPQINFKTWKVTLLGEDQKDGTDLVVPIPDDVVLRAYLNTRRFLQAPDNFVFGTPDGKFIEKFTIAHLARDR